MPSAGEVLSPVIAVNQNCGFQSISKFILLSSVDSKMLGPKGATQSVVLTLCPSKERPGRQTPYPQRKDSVRIA